MSNTEYTRKQPDEHRLMPNMLRALNGNRALADQTIAEVEDSLWLAEHDAKVRAEVIQRLRDTAQSERADSTHNAVADWLEREEFPAPTVQP